ncbi:MAG: class I SAM-dependent methyltransferase [Spirochaetes bacterium]|nr:class I SAM-dependent methyltransferase [Spirochaetota bacterium]
MKRERIPETNVGIQGECTVAMFDAFQRSMRDRGLLETGRMIRAGVTKGHALEVGPGPGYLGLEWLRNTEETRLTAVDISPDMIRVAERNAREYGFSDGRVTYVLSNADVLPFEDDSFDAVFSNGSLHEWENSLGVLNEVARVLKPSGVVFISDLRRDIHPLIRFVMHVTARPKEIRSGLETSINAAYTENELKAMLARTTLDCWKVTCNPFGVEIVGGNNIQ